MFNHIKYETRDSIQRSLCTYTWSCGIVIGSSWVDVAWGHRLIYVNSSILYAEHKPTTAGATPHHNLYMY